MEDDKDRFGERVDTPAVAGEPRQRIADASAVVKEQRKSLKAREQVGRQVVGHGLSGCGPRECENRIQYTRQGK